MKRAEMRKMAEKMFKQVGMKDEKLKVKMYKMLEIMNSMDKPTMETFQKMAAKLIKSFGRGTCTQILVWAQALCKCLEIEVAIAFERELAAENAKHSKLRGVGLVRFPGDEV